MTLTIKEAAEYSNIGINKIDSMFRTPNCLVVLSAERKNLQVLRILNILPTFHI